VTNYDLLILHSVRV